MNIAKRFAALLRNKRTLATVVADRGDGTAEVTGPDGDAYIISLAGVSVSASDKLVIERETAIAKAPTLTEYSIDV